MSDTTTAPPATAAALVARLRHPRTYLWAVGSVLLLAFPFYLDRFWLQAGLFAMAAAIGAIGLNLLTGATGQLSMGHAFFLAVGAYGYCVLAGRAVRRTDTSSPDSACPAGSPPCSPYFSRAPPHGLFSPIASRPARRLSRHRHAGADLHRPACAVQRRLPHRRLQRPCGTDPFALRLRLRRHRGHRRRSAVPVLREALVRGAARPAPERPVRPRSAARASRAGRSTPSATTASRPV